MVTLTNAVDLPQNNYKHLNVISDSGNNVVWCEMNNDSKACFTRELLEEIRASQDWFIEHSKHQFFVISSASESVFSFGGDLSLFQQLIQRQDKDGLYDYMKRCVDTLHGISMMPECEGIALVQGTAFGGGFEAALACDTIIAEKSATFGFPERLFNSIPGIGAAYKYLLRRIEPVKAQRIIKSAKTYSAEELYEIGVVDKLVPDGEGRDAVYDHIKHYTRYSNSYKSLKQIFQNNSILNYDELFNLGELWVNTAMNLSARDLELMDRLASSQNRQITN